jgi:transcription antitermination factor NusG
LRRKEIDEFLPTYKVRRRWADRIKTLDLPLFSGYLFVKLDLERRAAALTIPGVLHLVGAGSVPSPIDDREIAALQALVESQLAVQPWPFLAVGERVRVQEGPLRNVEGIVTEVKGGHRLVVSVTLLQRSVAVEIDRTSVTPVTPAGRRPPQPEHPAAIRFRVGS